MRIPFSNRFITATLALFAGLALYADDNVASKKQQTELTATRMQEPSYDKDGRLLRPSGYEKWVVVGTSIELDILMETNLTRAIRDISQRLPSA